MAVNVEDWTSDLFFTAFHTSKVKTSASTYIISIETRQDCYPLGSLIRNAVTCKLMTFYCLMLVKQWWHLYFSQPSLIISTSVEISKYTLKISSASCVTFLSFSFHSAPPKVTFKDSHSSPQIYVWKAINWSSKHQTCFFVLAVNFKDAVVYNCFDIYSRGFVLLNTLM